MRIPFSALAGVLGCYSLIAANVSSSHATADAVASQEGTVPAVAPVPEASVAGLYVSDKNPDVIEPRSGFVFSGAVSTHIGWGIGEDYIRAAINYETPVLWSLDLDWFGRLELTGEFGVSYWTAVHHQPTHSDVVQFEALPLWRWWFLDPFYMEGGVGFAAFTSTYFMDRQISTAFQFGDQVGFGVQLSDNMRLGARFAHFSNASIKRPNPGLNIWFITFAYEF